MLQLKQATLRRGMKTLLDKADLLIHPGEKIGFVGSNGAGKSSLFALLRGELECESGEVSIANHVTMAQIRQEIPSGKIIILDYVLAGDEKLSAIKQQLQQAEQHDDGVHLANLYQTYADLGGYSAESRAAKLLIGLGFTQAQLADVIDDFSGGWRMRLNLARLLMAPADVLLLDEPTNHLDLEAILWLEQWLIELPQTLLIISHDREFLDHVVRRVIHFDQGSLKSYNGNYSNFERQYAENLALQSATYAKQQQKIAHLQSFVDRFRAKATKAKQAQSRLKMIERMEKVAPVHLASAFQFEFKAAPDAGNPMMIIDKVNMGYEKNIILEQVSLSIYPGDRIALLGPNGAGKSTLIKVLAEQIPARGKIIRSDKLKIGYFAQHQLEQLRAAEGALWHLQHLDPSIQEKEGRSFLGGFDFQGDRVFEPISNFSGGEKARLALALLIWQRPNLLLLDEPSNHLDLEMREALALALQSYTGALVLITHDRYLIKTLVDDLYLVANGKAQRFDGDVDSYKDWLDTQNKLVEPVVEKKIKTETKVKPAKPVNIEKKLVKLEAELEKQQQQLKTVEAKIIESYSNGQYQVETLLQQQTSITDKINQLEITILEMLE